MESGSHQRPGRDELVDAFGPMVERIARRIWRALRLRIDVDDLVQLGMVGLIEAWERFDDTAGVPFGATKTRLFGSFSTRASASGPR